MIYPCKQPGCSAPVEFDGEIKVTGNLPFTEHFSNNAYHIVLPDVPLQEKTTGEVIIRQPLFAEHASQSVFFQIGATGQRHQKHTFYLTCTQGHTLPYEILLEDASED